MRALVSLGFALICASAAGSATISCGEGGPVAVAPDPAMAHQICGAAQQASDLLGRCDIQAPASLTITAVGETVPGCIGVYHCGEHRIEVLTPEAIEEVRRPDALFAHIPADRYFDSVVVHEIVHALYDDSPCPFATCVASSEYLAYALQIDSLRLEDRGPITAQAPLDKTISRDTISPMILFMAPDKFALLSWAHLHQRENRCAWLRGVLDGSILFDRERP